eukprot:6289712-Prymnesium_polylepis.1
MGPRAASCLFRASAQDAPPSPLRCNPSRAPLPRAPPAHPSRRTPPARPRRLHEAGVLPADAPEGEGARTSSASVYSHGGGDVPDRM